jgi:hypothetical protein
MADMALNMRGRRSSVSQGPYLESESIVNNAKEEIHICHPETDNVLDDVR